MAEGKRRKKRFFASGSWQQPRRGRFSSAAGARGGRPDPCKVFVGNISFAASMDELRDVFEEFGPVWHCHIVRDQRTRRSKGFGFVTFGDVDAVERALSASEDKLTLDGRTLRLDRPVSKKKLSARSKGGGSCGLRDGDSSSGVVEEQPQDEGSLPGVAEDPQASMTSRDQQCSPSVPELNDDVLFLVMTHLSLKDRIRVERVSKRWRCVAKASWRRIHHISFENCFQSFSGKYGGLCDSILQSVLVRGGKSAVSLDLSCTPKSISESGLALIGMYCSDLERLDLSGVPLSEEAMKKLSQKCPEIKCLILSGCHTFGEKCVWWGLLNWKKLQYLEISLNGRVKGQCFYLARTSLAHVHLRHCHNLVDSSVELLASHCPQLQSLDLSRCAGLTGASVRSVTKHCRDLKVLKFCGPNDDVAVTDLITLGLLHNLEVLYVDEKPTFCNPVLKTLGTECPNLISLSCSACHAVDDEGVSCLSNCHQLSHLNISYCREVTDQGLSRALNAGMTKICIRACHEISNDGIAVVARECLQLEELDVCGCLFLSGACLQPLEEALLNLRSPLHRTLTLVVGGSGIPKKALQTFASTTNATINYNDLSDPALCDDHYDDFYDLGWLSVDEEEEDCGWNEFSPDHPFSYADDYLLADDPALFSDDFSDPEDWGFGF